MATALVDLYGGQPLPFDRLILAEGYRPTDREEFMCDKHRAYFLHKLKDWKEDIIRESRATMAQLQIEASSSMIITAFTIQSAWTKRP